MEDEVLDGSIEQDEAAGESSDAEGAGEEKQTEEQKQLKALQKELAEMRKLAREKEEGEKFWAEKAKKLAATSESERKPKQQAQPLEDDEDDPAAFVEKLAAKGSKALKDKGFVKAEDVAEIVKRALAEHADASAQAAAEVREMAAELGLDEDDPDMMSAVRKQILKVQKEFPELKQTSVLKLAAERAKSMTNNNGNNDRDSRAERARLASGGGRGASGGMLPRGGSSATPTLSANDRAVLEGFGLDPKKFLAEKASKGNY